MTNFEELEQAGNAFAHQQQLEEEQQIIDDYFASEQEALASAGAAAEAEAEVMESIQEAEALRGAEQGPHEN